MSTKTTSHYHVFVYCFCYTSQFGHSEALVIQVHICTSKWYHFVIHLHIFYWNTCTIIHHCFCTHLVGKWRKQTIQNGAPGSEVSTLYHANIWNEEDGIIYFFTNFSLLASQYLHPACSKPCTPGMQFECYPVGCIPYFL